MYISGSIKTSEILQKGLKIIDAMDYEGKIIVNLSDGKWYYYDRDIIQADVNGGPIQDLINQLKDKHKK